VLIDCEHFFDGYKNNPQFALRIVNAASEAGAETVILCDTNGGTLLGPNDTAAAFASNLLPVSAAIPITFLLLTLAALLLPIDIAARRLSSVEFLVVGYRWLMARLQRWIPQLAPAQGQVSDVADDSLLGKMRARREERRSRAASVKAAVLDGERQGAKPVVSRSQVRTDTRPGSTTPAPTAQQDVSVAERLLEEKRKRERGKVKKNIAQ